VEVLHFSLLGSGSSGNAILLRSRGTKILIDNGLSFKQLSQRLEAVGEGMDGLTGVLVTHEHGDHVGGLGVLTRKMAVPIYMTRGTYQNLPATLGLQGDIHFFEAGDELHLGDMEVQTFSVSHDAADPVGFTVRAEGAQFGLATDLGHASHLVRNRLAGSHALVIESNYCPEMLRNGHYPPQIQQRIRGRQGHLSNEDMCSLLHSLLHEGLQLVILVHISEKNNTPELVERRVRGVLKEHGAAMFLATQDAPTPLFQVCAP
jgi:phosphoribosyl 1,2-cyclic phosphodiesterase